MKMPKKPPFLSSETLSSLTKIAKEHGGEQSDFLLKAFSSGIGATFEGRYMHWDELIRHEPPEGMTREMVWAMMKMQRLGRWKSIPLRDRDQRPFVHATELPNPGQEILRSVDMSAGGQILSENRAPDGYKRDQYVFRCLIEESIFSSQIEGASTTRKVAMEMIRSGRKPRDKSERMILNNYVTMQHIRTLTDKKLSPGVVLDLHRRITADTLDDPSECGRLRRVDEPVHVVERHSEEVLYTPPPASELEERLTRMCDFANGKTPDHWLHPIVRAIILHFWLAFDHPFVDGNGRTARSLFYWSMLRNGYPLFEYVSISRLIRKAQGQYSQAFLYTETDENDLTYFILYHLGVIKRAVEEVRSYLRRKAAELERLSARLSGMRELNHRQRDLLAHALKKPDTEYTVKSHMTRQSVTHQTARMDLYNLVDRGLFVMNRKAGRAVFFYPVKDLERRLEQAEA
jgi:Fic family protein